MITKPTRKSYYLQLISLKKNYLVKALSGIRRKGD